MNELTTSHQLFLGKDYSRRNTQEQLMEDEDGNNACLGHTVASSAYPVTTRWSFLRARHELTGNSIEVVLHRWNSCPGYNITLRSARTTGSSRHMLALPTSTPGSCCGFSKMCPGS